MRTTDGYKIPDEHLKYIKLTVDPNYNIISIQRINNSEIDCYSIEGTTLGLPHLKYYTIELWWLTQTIREGKIGDILD
jgi:hypothetical protein